MIRINLLQGPKGRKVRGQWDLRVEVAAAVGLIVLTLIMCMYYSGSVGEEIEVKQIEQQRKQQQLAALKEKAKKVKDFERTKRQLESKNRIIEQLEKRRGGPVQILDFLSRSLEPFKLWLIRVRLDDKAVELQGQALGNDDVVSFVNSLRRGDLFEAITLGDITAKQEGKVRTYRFKLKMAVKEG